MCAKKVVRYKNVNGVLVKQYESPALIDGIVDISQLPIVGAMGSAVIENGENANGRWVKWADGTMVCYGEVTTNALTDTSDIGVNIKTYYGVAGWVYPVAFMVRPLILTNVRDTLPGMFASNVQETPTITGCSVCAFGNSTTTGLLINCIAIGRWK